jgi:hypothetical protein
VPYTIPPTLARQHPLAAIPVSLLLGGINASGGLLQRTAHLPDATVKVLQGILFVVILASETFYGRWNWLPGRRATSGVCVGKSAQKVPVLEADPVETSEVDPGQVKGIA